jgi:Fe-S-cluster containining protein
VTDILRGGGHLTWTEARRSPCLDCPQSYCCTHLVVHEFELRRLVDVDFALYLLNFDGIVLGLDDELKVSVYLNQSCTHLDTETGLCRVYATPQQPAVCRHYPAFDCFYRLRMDHGLHPRLPLADGPRMRWLADQLLFDDHRRLVAGPEWDDVLAGFAERPLGHHPAPPPPTPPALQDWQAVAVGRPPAPSSDAARSDPGPGLPDPCSGCAAWCCHTLVFDRPVPQSAAGLEHIRFMLGFPSVELGIADGDWGIFVHTRCRHLDAGRCGIFGDPERPLRCSAYDPLGCSYKPIFSRAEPDGVVRVSFEQFPLVEEMIVFDEAGAIAALPPAELIRHRLREAAGEAPR